MPSVDFFLNDGSESMENVRDYPFQGTFSEVKDKPFAILHTSGSTGIPKPVFVTHGTFASEDAHQLIPSMGGQPTWVDKIRGKRVFIGLPLFHAACLGMLAFGIFAGATCVLPPPRPLTADLVDFMHTYGNVQGSLIAPSIIMDLYSNPDHLSNMLRQLSFLAYVGGPLAQSIGNDISSKLQLITVFGTTENMFFPIEMRDDNPAEWEYIQYSPFLGHIYRPVDNLLCELVIVRNPDYHLFQGVFSTFPKINEYGTSDLYEAHPSKTGLWRFRLRSDDIICFSNAEKLNPISMEATITGHPRVQSAVIGGHGHFQACLLIEPKTYPSTPEETQLFINDVWPTVMEANKDCPAHGRVMKDFIMMTDPLRPLPRAGKDSVQRYAVFQLYEHEFEAIYNQEDDIERPTFKLASVQAVDSHQANSAKTNGVRVSDSTASPAEVNGVQSNIISSETEAYSEDVLHRIVSKVVTEQLNQALGQAMGQVAAHLLRGAKGPLLLDRILQGKYQQSSNVSVQGNGANGGGANTLGPSHLKQVLLQVLSDTTYLSGLTDDANMFECGLDSVQLPALVKQINSTLGDLKMKTGTVSMKTIYENPSVNGLVQVIGGGDSI